MAANWETEMQDKFDKLQAAVSEEFRTQLTSQLTEFRTQLTSQLTEFRTQLTTQLTDMSSQIEERLEKRLDARLSQRFKVQAEEIREIVKTTADNYGGVLDAIRRDLGDFREEWRKKADVTDAILANHAGRLGAIEKTLSDR